MIVTLLAAALVAASPFQADTLRGNRRVADPPRLEAPQIRVDGRLDEEAWSTPALLGAFRQSLPAEGAPASDRTEGPTFSPPPDL